MLVILDIVICEKFQDKSSQLYNIMSYGCQLLVDINQAIIKDSSYSIPESVKFEEKKILLSANIHLLQHYYRNLVSS